MANPLDLTEILALSPFRSCMGHDYSGWNVEGVKETNRSLKHYVMQHEHVEKAKVRAPFDGRIIEIQDDGPRGDQVWIAPNASPLWRFIFFHIDLLPPLGLRSPVKAGQLIGYSNVQQSMNFDVAVKKFSLFKGPNILDSPFHHMGEAVLADYAGHGLVPENMIIPKEYRDAHPCHFESGQDELIYLK